ncbi:carnitine O-acetyltransferase-like isoform X2 [Gigantopelta aegis]|uniref:carnitine O-acetyltransferase-like isoform X2 n=1 Tax=Gigantopelta aegis TaxID=1735272 RepID=UPI001B88AB52|nr:carnitine O-acetyltransferase-like isoform X2 [Gigantopelta aegis]XP_041369474.1 carnitine O-acetyltransferase-like isoform X2 [Gigantopelta aegis]
MDVQRTLGLHSICISNTMTSSYPVSKLNDTLTELKRVFKEILQPDEAEKFDELLEEANATSLPTVQKIFESSVKNKKNWNAEYGRQFMLSIRFPIPVSTAMSFVLEVDSNHSSQVARAASLLVAVGQIYSDPSMMEEMTNAFVRRGAKENYLDEMLLAACRVPGMEKDEYVVYKDVRHVLLISKNSMFTIDILDDNRQVIPAGMIVNHLEYIINHSGECNANPLALTALPRNDWHVTRLDLLKDKSNQESLATAESSIVTLVLEDQPSPMPLSKTLQHIQFGRPSFRYYDKLVNVIVYRDGQAGLFVDHACSDSYVAAKLCMLINKLANDVHISPQPNGSNSYPASLHISTPEKTVPTSIWDHPDRDVATFEFPVCSNLLNILERSYVRDAWLHLSLQLAILELTGTSSFLILEPTYIDNFKNGGTDATFPMSMQSRELVTKLKEGSPFGSLMTSLKAALAEHRRLVKNTKTGKAYGSHISALQSILNRQAPGHPLLPYLQRFQKPDVMMTGASEGGHLLRAAAGNVFADNQLVVTYILKENEIAFVLTTSGTFSTMLPTIPNALSKSLNRLLQLIVCHVSAGAMMKNSVPDSTTKAEYTSYLHPTPNTLGTVIVQHDGQPQGIRLLDDADGLVSFMAYGKSVALRLQTQLGVERCGMIALFLPNDKPKMHVVPFHGLGKNWISVVAEEQEYSPVYKGYVTSVEGPRVSNQELTLMQKRLLAGDVVPKWDNTFNGDPKDNNLFARLVRGELPHWRVWEDDHHIAFLTPFPNTPGFTVLVPREHLSSNIIGLPDENFTKLFRAVHKVATELMSSLSLDGCAIVCEGMEIDYAHVKVIPLRETSSCEHHVTDQLHETYPGFLSTKHGPEMDINQLVGIATKLALV